jgi:hypothetical protein
MSEPKRDPRQAHIYRVLARGYSRSKADVAKKYEAAARYYDQPQHSADQRVPDDAADRKPSP